MQPRALEQSKNLACFSILKKKKKKTLCISPESSLFYLTWNCMKTIPKVISTSWVSPVAHAAESTEAGWGGSCPGCWSLLCFPGFAAGGSPYEDHTACVREWIWVHLCLLPISCTWNWQAHLRVTLHPLTFPPFVVKIERDNYIHSLGTRDIVDCKITDYKRSEQFQDLIHLHLSRQERNYETGDRAADADGCWAGGVRENHPGQLHFRTEAELKPKANVDMITLLKTRPEPHLHFTIICEHRLLSKFPQQDTNFANKNIS